MTASSTVEFLMWLLIAAAVIAVIANRSRIPYMVALVLGGLALGSLRLPVLQSIYQAHRPDWLTPDVILIFFLPVLLFEGSLKINLRQLIENLVPILVWNVLKNRSLPVRSGSHHCRKRSGKTLNVRIRVSRDAQCQTN